MLARLISLFLSVFIFVFVIELIRRERLTFKYALAWIIFSVAGIFFSVFDKALFFIASALGFSLPSNFIFFSLLAVFVFVSLLLTIFLCQQNCRNDALAQKIGILESEIKELKKKVS